jgi:hypothetical protein
VGVVVRIDMNDGLVLCAGTVVEVVLGDDIPDVSPASVRSVGVVTILDVVVGVLVRVQSYVDEPGAGVVVWLGRDGVVVTVERGRGGGCGGGDGVVVVVRIEHGVRLGWGDSSTSASTSLSPSPSR